MARISKKGLDYFPMDVHFVQSKEARLLMKREGDTALSILLALYSEIYGGEGYHMVADEDTLEYLSTHFYSITVEDIKRVVKAAVKLGVFEARLYQEKGILTSKQIQEQYLFAKKRSKTVSIRRDFSSLQPTEDKDNTIQSATNKGQNATLMPQRKEKGKNSKK